jgi:ubiquinone/menaquinone biosynthesis C-methylase UbiE
VPLPTDQRDWRPFYSREAARYDATRYGGLYGRLFEQLHRETLASLLQPLLPGRALELAAGTGHTSLLLASLGFDLIATDVTAAMLGRGREQLRERGLSARFVLGDAFRLPFAEASFRLAVATRFLHLWPAREQRAIIAEMARVVEPGGAALLDFDNWWHRTLLAAPIWLYQVLRGKRVVGEHYNRIRSSIALVESAGLRVADVQGVAGNHLVAAAALSHRLGLMLGRLHARPPLRMLAEQFVVLARKP